MSQILEISLLGGFSLIYDGHSIRDIAAGRSQQLLAYLLLHRSTAQPRERIAFLMWPQATETQARANLRKLLSGLRRLLPNADAFLWSDTKSLQWIPGADFSLDVAEFQAAIKEGEQVFDRTSRQAALERAIHCYQGDLLPNYEDEWIVLEREQLQQMQSRALEQLIGMLEERHNYSMALSYAQKLLQMNDLNEAAYYTLMRLYGLSGDRANALQSYHQCMTILREELGIVPSTNTRQLYEQLLDEDAPLAQPSHRASCSASLRPLRSLPQPLLSNKVSPLVGRESERAILLQWAQPILSNGHDGESKIAKTMVLLIGEPGIGKTRLLEELLTIASASNAQVLRGNGFAAEMMRPFGVWIDALRTSAMLPNVSPLPELGYLLPELGQSSQAPTELSHLFDAIVTLLNQWAQAAPLFILFDDIQWLDEASSALLHYAMRLLRPLPVAFVCTARDGELAENVAAWQVIQALNREQQLQTLELQPLNQEQTADLMHQINKGESSVLSSAVIHQAFLDSGGNPLFVIEIARSLAPHQSVPSNTLEVLIRARLQQLDAAAREFLPWAAVWGRSFNPSTVAQIADYQVNKLLTAIEVLEQQALIRPGASLGQEIRYDFVHDIVRQVVYRQLSEPRRRLMHARIAYTLQQVTQDDSLTSKIAYHAALGDNPALAASSALAAAKRCLKLFAYTEALELADQGIQQCKFLEPSTRLSLQAGLLRIYATVGYTSNTGSSEHRADCVADLETQIQQLIQEAAALGLTEAEASAHETMIALQFGQNNFTEVHEHSLRVADTSQIASPATMARRLAYSGSCLAEIGRDLLRAEALLAEAQLIAERVGLELCDIFCGWGCVHRHYGRYDEARSQLQRAWQLAQAQKDHWRECVYLSYLAMTELEADSPTTALPHCREMAVVAAKIPGEGSEAATALALEALVHYRYPHLKTEQAVSEQALTNAIVTLEELDAKRLLAYILMEVAEQDLKGDRDGTPDSDCIALAVSRAQTALQNAQAINHPSEIVLSWTLLIQGLLQLEHYDQAAVQFEQFEISLRSMSHHDLNYRAQIAMQQIRQHMRQ
ncbi:MAG: BTAD domain-containing putative transcriptional regulator [Cyanobacteria bacterium P01_H01_bin.152]